MPLIDLDTVTRFEDTIPGRGAITPQLDDARPSFLDVASSALRQHNIVSSFYDRIANEPALPAQQEGYDPFADIAGFEDYAERFVRSRSPAETQLIKDRIRAELSDRDVLRRAGGFGLAASIAAGAVDPLTLASMAIPVAPALAGAARAARIGAGVAANVALDTASEVVLHQTQDLRTVEESAINVGAGALLTGGFGVFATRVPKSEFERLRAKLDSELQAPPSSTVGAARVGATTLDDESIAAGGETIAKTLGKLSPITRLMQAPVKGARVLAQELAEVPYALKKNLRGIATPTSVETRVKQLTAIRGHQIVRTLDGAYARYRQAGGTLNLKEFGREVSKAMRRGDAHEIPEVADVARQTRKLFETDREVLQKLGALPEEIEVIGAKSYFPRVYDQHAIAANRSELERRLESWFRENPRKDENGSVIEREAA
jgi:hypothetical protein